MPQKKTFFFSCFFFMQNLVYFFLLVLGWNDPFYEIHLAITHTFVNELNHWIKAGVRLWIQSTCMGSKLGPVIKHFLCKQRQRVKKTAFNSVKALPKITTCPRRDCVLSQRKQVRRKWSEMEEDFTMCVCVCVVIEENHESVGLWRSNRTCFKEIRSFQKLHIFTWRSFWLEWVNAKPRITASQWFPLQNNSWGHWV